MTQTLRRELIQVIKKGVDAWLASSQGFLGEEIAVDAAGKIADDILSVAGITKKEDSVSLKNEIEKNLSIENAIFLGKEVTESVVEKQSIKDVAPKMFEKALGFSRPLPWWGNKDWNEFAEWVCQRHSESGAIFGEYNIWRNTPYTKGGMSNNRIRGFVTEFYDSWDMFMMSKKPIQDEPARPEHVRFTGGEDVQDAVPNPFKKPAILRRPNSVDSN